LFSNTRNGTIPGAVSGDPWLLVPALPGLEFFEVGYLPGGRLWDEALLEIPSFVEGLNSTDFWELMGLLFEGMHWLYLGDLGEIAVTQYPLMDVSWDYGQFGLNFSNPAVFPPTNNIFVNASLYKMVRDSTFYIPYMDGTLNASSNGVPEFNNTNFFPLKANDSVVLSQSYYCQQRRLKHPINLLLTVIAADYALIVGGYTLTVFIASLIEKARKEGILQEYLGCDLMSSQLL
jgi:hypothetical protein